MLARGQFIESLEITRTQLATDPVVLIQPLPEVEQAAAF